MTARPLVPALLLPSLVLVQAVANAALEDVIISEVQAINSSTVTDEDGDFPDWVELYNAGAEPVDLQGSYLTDDRLEPTKWRFPRTVLQPDSFLVVFCSDKDRRTSGQELHANFRISSAGEYLALIAPDGVSEIDALDPTPELVADFSYGARMDATFVELVGPSAPLEIRVPTSGDTALADSLDWTLPGNGGNGWDAGSQGVGYDNSSDYDPLIATDVESRMDGVNTTIWIRYEFDLADAASLESLILRVKYDDGFLAYLNGNLVADGNAPPSPGDWDEAATDDHPDDQAQQFEEWSFPNAGRLRDGENVLAIHGLNRGLSSSDFLIIAELEAVGGGVLQPGEREFFAIPTPGSGNVPGFPGISPKPVLEPPNQVFSGNLELDMNVDLAEAEIRYTLDRSDPDESSLLYTGPVSLDGTTFVRARSFAPGLSPSPVVEGSFLSMASNLQGRSSDVPIVVVDTLGRSIPSTGSTNFGPAFMVVFDRGSDGRAAFGDVPQIANRIGIKERGSSSAGRPKKSYRFEFWDSEDDDLDLKPLDMPRESDWILYGAYNFDQTHMRNPFIYEMSRQVGRWAARTRFIELYLNTNGGDLSASDYWGVYSFMENVKRGDDRVDVERLNPSDTTLPEIQGGYILKKDRGDPGGSGSFSAGGISSIQFSYPDVTETNSQQRSWIQNHLSTVFTTSNFMSVIDPLAAIDHHLLNAYPKNVDAFRLSGYFHKPRNGPVTFGPIWDFDRSMDSTDGRDNAFNTWRGTGDSSGYFSFDNRTPYWSRWLQDRDFLQLWIDRWFELRDGPLSHTNVTTIIDRMRSELSEAGPRDQSRWNQTSNWFASVNHLRNWLINRANWIDSQWRPRPEFSRSGGTVPPGTELEITAPSGTIYFTMDGSDPREPGGGIASGAVEYSGAISIQGNARVVARARASATSWSAPRAETFVITPPPVVVTEIMFHPADPPEGSALNDDDFEFVELANIGPEPIDLTGFSLAGGIAFTFGNFIGENNAVIGRDERIVVVKDLEAFASRYDTSGLRIAGEYDGRLNNAGDSLKLFGPLLEPIHNFIYREDWYPSTDGDGHSLSIVDAFLPLPEFGQSASWAPSSVVDGTPGAIDPGLESGGGRQVPGDANQDGRLDIGDAFSLLLHLFVADRPVPCEGATIADEANRDLLDLNGDVSVDVSDATYLLTYLFRSGAPPVLGERCVRIEGCPDICRFR